MARDGIKHVLGFFTSAYSSYSGCRQYRENLDEACDVVGQDAPKIDKIRVYYNDPNFIRANCVQIRKALSRLPEERQGKSLLLFTTHSLPISMAECCAYEQQLYKTGELIVNELDWKDWKLVYQSVADPPPSLASNQTFVITYES